MPGFTMLLGSSELQDRQDLNEIYWTKFYPIYELLTQDPEEEIRAACSLVLPDMIKIVGNGSPTLFERFFETLDDTSP
jgi:hypothetical protein